MLKALSQRYPGQLELRAPLGATPLNLRMSAQTAARYEDILAHVTLTGAGSRDSRLLPIWDQTRIHGTRGIATPETGGRLRAPPNKPTAASGPGGRWGSVVFGWRALRPPRVVFVIGCVSCNDPHTM